MCPLAQPGCWRACCQAGLGGGGAPDAGSGPSLREFPHGGADACIPRQGVTLLYGPSVCTRSVQMDLRRNQVRRPFPTPGSGTLWVSGESLRDRRVSCLPRWTVCPTRSPSQDTNRSTCRGECSWSGPLATPPSRCHLGPLANGPGRNPPYCLRSDGADTDTGGAPKPQRSGTSPASFAGPCHPGSPPYVVVLVPASLLSSPGASPCPAALAVLPGSRHVPSAPAICPCPGVLVSFVVCFWFFFLFFSFPPPMSPRCLLAVLALFVGGWRRRGRGGGGVLAVRPIAQARRKHGAGTRRGTCPSAGGAGVCRVPPVVTLPFLRLHPRRSPCSLWAPFGHGHVVCPALSFLCLPTLPRRPQGGGPLPATVTPLVPSPSLRCPRPFPWWVWELGVGRGGRPRCPSSGVSTSQARRWHMAWHLSFCWGVGHASWPPSSLFPLCVRSPGAPPAGACTALASLGHGRVVRRAPSPRCSPTLPLCPREGRPLSAPPFLHPPPLGGQRCVWGGGGGLSFSLRCSHAAGTRRGIRPSAGGGGMPRGSRRRPFYPTLAPPVVPPPGLARRVPPSGTVVWFVPHPPTAASPPCRVALGGGGRFSLPPYPQSPPSGGRGWVGGGRGALVVSPSLHARRRHDVGTTQSRGEALGCRGGGGFPFGPSRPSPWYRLRTPGSPAAVAPRR